ncbi:uncharacterized protein LOC106656617 [Trichogramma pretiosum]|uniref:uncharacterized protein LOC106656617 n=1 Tax=Trichogramma pretiosum TaxID=7493 RepID=UPI0006C97A9A|nr:uncharacterized protein LOC106656617 [Trichogramma pretiosum]
MKYSFALFLIFAVVCGTQASAVHKTGFFQDSVESLKQSIDSMLLRTIREVQQLNEKVQEKSERVFGYVQEKAYQAMKTVRHQIRRPLDEVNETLAKLQKTSEEKNVDLSHCAEIAVRHRQMILSKLDGSAQCFEKTLDRVAGNLDQIKSDSNDVLASLNEILEESTECLANPEQSILMNLACLTDKKLKAIWEVTKNVPMMTVNLVRFVGGAVTSPVPTTYCVSQSAFNLLTSQVPAKMKAVHMCVKKTVDDMFHKATTEAPASESPAAEDDQATVASVPETAETSSTAAPVEVSTTEAGPLGPVGDALFPEDVATQVPEVDN